MDVPLLFVKNLALRELLFACFTDSEKSTLVIIAKRFLPQLPDFRVSLPILLHLRFLILIGL